VHDRHFSRRIIAEISHDTAETFGKQGFSDPRGAHHGQVVTTRRSDLEAMAGLRVPTHVCKIRALQLHRRKFHGGRTDSLTAKNRHRFGQVMRAMH
jgi:hypothetical protein